MRSVGADIGGSWLRVALAESTAQGSARITHKARIPISRSVAPLKQLLKRWRVRPDFLVLGSTGIWERKDRSAVTRALKPLARRVRVLSDMELAWAAFLGQCGQGVIVLAGTGSSIYGRDLGGRCVRVGGLGPLLGDEGSAFWIGREWLKSRPEAESLYYAHQPDAVRAIAATAKKVLAQYPRHPLARKIVENAVDHLVRQTTSAARKLRFNRDIPIACHGGLFQNAKFQSAFKRKLALSSLHWKLFAEREATEVAAAKLALNPLRRNLFL